jgi:ADP-ribose pyrophosphatase
VTTVDEIRVLYEGKYLKLVSRGKWEFVRRKCTSGVVGIVAVTDDGHLVLVEQYRPPIASRSIELPAGLAGDVPGSHDESLVAAARRELMEETGYAADEFIVLAEGVSTAGLSDEMVTLMLARGLRKNGHGGGDASEKITVHEVPLEQVNAFLRGHSRDGAAIDFKIYAGLYLMQTATDCG